MKLFTFLLLILICPCISKSQVENIGELISMREYSMDKMLAFCANNNFTYRSEDYSEKMGYRWDKNIQSASGNLIDHVTIFFQPGSKSITNALIYSTYNKDFFQSALAEYKKWGLAPDDDYLDKNGMPVKTFRRKSKPDENIIIRAFTIPAVPGKYAVTYTFILEDYLLFLLNR